MGTSISENGDTQLCPNPRSDLFGYLGCVIQAGFSKWVEWKQVDCSNMVVRQPVERAMLTFSAGLDEAEEWDLGRY